MSRRRSVLPFFIISCMLFSCSDENFLEETLMGAWVIDTIYYKNYNVKNCLDAEFINIESKENVFLPNGNFCDNLTETSTQSKAKFQLLKSKDHLDTIPYSIKILTDNKLFSANHEIVFYKDKRNYLFKLELYSDSVYIMCHKILFDYSKNDRLMNKAEKLTWSTRPN